jgi:hypothetical protein
MLAVSVTHVVLVHSATVIAVNAVTSKVVVVKRAVATMKATLAA